MFTYATSVNFGANQVVNYLPSPATFTDTQFQH